MTLSACLTPAASCLPRLIPPASRTPTVAKQNERRKKMYANTKSRDAPRCFAADIWIFKRWRFGSRCRPLPFAYGQLAAVRASRPAGGPDLHLYFVQCCFDTPLFPCSCFMRALVNNATHTHTLNKCRLYEGGVRAAEPNMWITHVRST